MDQRVRREGEREGERADEVKRECRRRLVEARGRAERGVTGGDVWQGEVERHSFPSPLKRCKC